MTSFYINKASGPAKLYIRVRHQGNDKKVATEITVDAAKWNKRKEKPSTIAATEQIRRVLDARPLKMRLNRYIGLYLSYGP